MAFDGIAAVLLGGFVSESNMELIHAKEGEREHRPHIDAWRDSVFVISM